jgi:hypothetical protein
MEFTFRECLERLITLMMEAASTSETSADFYQTTRRNNPEDSHLQDDTRSVNFPVFYKQQMFITVFIKSQTLDPILNQMNPVRRVPPYLLFKINFNNAIHLRFGIQVSSICCHQ